MALARLKFKPSAFVRYWAVVRAENSLLSYRINISTFCSFTGQTFGQKVINCPAIANAWTLPASLMTHLKSLTIIFFFTWSMTAFGQTKPPTEKVVHNTFKNVFKQATDAGYKWSRWTACNLDSAFYKSDTITLVSDENYFFNNGCCKTVDLTFSSRRNFTLQNVKGCMEVFNITVGKGANHYKLSFAVSDDFPLIIFTNDSSKDKIKFKVISMESLAVDYRGDRTILKLVRT